MESTLHTEILNHQKATIVVYARVVNQDGFFKKVRVPIFKLPVDNILSGNDIEKDDVLEIMVGIEEI